MTADQAQIVRDTFAQLIEREMPTTKKVLAAVPDGNREHKPDAKSRSVWDLATHIATSDVWFLDSIIDGKFVMSGGEGGTPPEMTSPAAVSEWYEQRVKERLATLRALPVDLLQRPVEFFGTTQPAVAWLGLMNNHSIHHRGQLAASLRAAGSKVPAIFGVSADENPFA